jgi:hypothetical protein
MNKDYEFKVYYTTQNGGTFFEEVVTVNCDNVKEVAKSYVEKHSKDAKQRQFKYEVEGFSEEESFMYVTVEELFTDNALGLGSCLEQYLDQFEDELLKANV